VALEAVIRYATGLGDPGAEEAELSRTGAEQAD
jgi:hypothetical protein